MITATVTIDFITISVVAYSITVMKGDDDVVAVASLSSPLLLLLWLVVKLPSVEPQFLLRYVGEILGCFVFVAAGWVVSIEINGSHTATRLRTKKSKDNNHNKQPAWRRYKSGCHSTYSYSCDVRIAVPIDPGAPLHSLPPPTTTTAATAAS